MALKSYLASKKSSYDCTKEMFSRFKNDLEIPVARYLGWYTHEYGEGSGLGTTYNLLLQYGEKILEGYFTDSPNVPSVRMGNNCILGVTIQGRSCHPKDPRLRISARQRSARPIYVEILWVCCFYLCCLLRANKKRWHADISPENILRVNGKLKFADFWYSNGGSAMPRGYIGRGFDTYGSFSFTTCTMWKDCD